MDTFEIGGNNGLRGPYEIECTNVIGACQQLLHGTLATSHGPQSVKHPQHSAAVLPSHQQLKVTRKNSKRSQQEESRRKNGGEQKSATSWAKSL